MSEIILKEGSTPSTPAAGQVSLYAKADGLPFVKNDAGVESPIALGGVWQDWTPVGRLVNSMTFTVTSIPYAKYCLIGEMCYVLARVYGTTGGTATTAIGISLPFDFDIAGGAGAFIYPGIIYDTAYTAGLSQLADTSGLTRVQTYWYDRRVVGLGASRGVCISFGYRYIR